MHSIREPLEPALLGWAHPFSKFADLCMARLDFYDDHAPAVWRLDKQVQLVSADGEVAGENAMAATAKPACRFPLTSTPCSNRRLPSDEPVQRRARNLIKAMETIFSSIILMSS